jgi:hypothetical protein
MAKLTGPLLSFGADGQIGKAMVTAKWRGIAYARQYVKPANPQTTAQQNNRTRFALLREMWKLAPSEVRDPFDTFALGRQFLGFNAFIGENNRLLNGETDLQAMLMSPGARGGLPPASVTAATGSSTGEIDVTIVPPSQLPDGWTVTQCAAAAVLDQDPVGIFDGPFVADVDSTDPYVITLGGFQASDACVGFGWVEYEKANGDTAYSVSLSDTATAAA